MQRTGDEFFTRSALTENQHRGIGVGYTLDNAIDGLHLRAGANHVIEAKLVLELLAQLDIFLNGMHGLALEQGIADAFDEFIDLERFLDEILGARP